MSFELALERIQAVCYSASRTAAGKLFHTTGMEQFGDREGSVAEFRSCPWNTGRRAESSPSRIIVTRLH